MMHNCFSLPDLIFLHIIKLYIVVNFIKGFYMKDTEKELREKLGITDPLQLLPVDGSIIPTEKIQRDFTSKISDDFLAELMKDRKLSTEQQQQVLNSVKNDNATVIEGHSSINSSNKKETFSERFKDAQRRIQLEETHKVISVNNSVVKLK